MARTARYKSIGRTGMGSLLGARVHPAAGLRVAAVLLAVACGGRAVVLFRQSEWRGLEDSPFGWMALAMVLFGVATYGRLVDRPWEDLAPHEQVTLGRKLLGLAGVVLGLLTMAAYALVGVPQAPLIASWAFAQVLLIVAVLPARPLTPRLRGWAVVEAGAVLLILVLTLLNRLWNNGEIPVAFHGDMASYGLQARAILHGQFGDFFADGWAGIPIIGFLPTAASLWLFGDSLSGLNTVPAIECVLALLALYLLARELFGWRIAVFALFLAAGDLLLLHYGRAAQYIDPVVFVAWSLYLFVRGLRRGSLWAFALSGLLAGYAVNMYYAGRIILPLLVAAVVFWGLASHRKLVDRRWGLLVAVFGLVLALGPTLVFDIRRPDLVTGRTQDVSIFGADVMRHSAGKYELDPSDVTGVLIEQFRRAVLFFWRFGDGAGQFGISRNLLDPVAGVLLILALAYAVLHARRPANALALVWLAGYVLAATLTVDAPFSARLVGLPLPAALLAGLALDRALGVIHGGRVWLGASVLIGLVAAAASVSHNWSAYMAWATNPRTANPMVHIGRFLLADTTGYPVVIVSDAFHWHERELEFLLPTRQGEDVRTADLVAGRVNWPRDPRIFVYLSPDFSIESQLHERYPQGRAVDGSIRPVTGVFHAYYTD